MTIARTPWWVWTWPVLAWVILSVTPFASPAGFIAAAAGVALILAVFAAVYHAEVVAHRTGEPFGTLVLAVAVTIIEVALIVSVMVAAPAEKAGLARDTVFAVVMIVCNGIVGLCLLWGGARHHEQGFQVPSTGIRSLADLVAAAKARPGALTFASGGNASPSHLCGEMLKRQAGIDMTHVPYSGAAPAMNAVLAGDVTMFCAPIPLGMVHFKAGKVYALGVTGTSPSPLLPDLTPLSAIYPGFVISTWLGLFAPVATPPAVTRSLYDELKKAYADPELQEKLAILALDPAWLSGAELSRRIETDTAKWMDLIKAANKAE